jgi:hypothetical protein
MKTLVISALAAVTIFACAGPTQARDYCGGHHHHHHHGSYSSFGLSLGLPLFYSRPAYSSYPSYPAYGYTYAPRYYSYQPAVRVSSPAVDLQIALARRGYVVGVIDGIIGPRTRSALRAFQSTNGLPVTGVADYPTLRRLRLR